ncbi:MAG: ribonuclease P protein component 1 [Thermoproteota archaeon]
MRTPRNLPYHELIGLEVKAVNPRTGLTVSGRVVWETKNMLVLLLETERRVAVPKHGRTFLFNLEGEEVEVSGDSIAYRPEDRTGRVDP